MRLVRSFGELPKEHFITIHTLNPDKKKKILRNRFTRKIGVLLEGFGV